MQAYGAPQSPIHLPNHVTDINSPPPRMAPGYTASDRTSAVASDTADTLLHQVSVSSKSPAAVPNGNIFTSMFAKHHYGKRSYLYSLLSTLGTDMVSDPLNWVQITAWCLLCMFEHHSIAADRPCV